MKEFAYIHDEKHSPSPLRAVPALASFSDDQLDDVLNSSSLLQCEPGDHIIQEGSIDSRIYVLLSGELEVRVGSKKVAAITRIGEVFGELALVNHDKRLASVIASNKAVCLAVDQKFLQDIHPREEDPDFHAALYEFVARLVVRKLEATSKRLAEVEKELRELKEANATAAAKPVASAPKLKRPVKRAPSAARKPARVR
ncbi:cyclic nucleotide-binding domain-containing protein [Prosthecobacter sp.]|uniref:cyclic nucleotide-binding domain-containing protein n=1 Tax=Prosthecobacter sp. TaxID=1965333 RepID=UPI003784CF18